MSEPLRVRVHKAMASGPEPVCGAIVEITREQPEYSTRKVDMWESDARFDSDSEAIEIGLWRSLPGGTYDRLLGRMLTRKATHFRVLHYQDGDK